MNFPPATPHDSITRVVDNVYLVRGAYPMGPGIRISRTMTIVQGDDGLVILNPIRLTNEGEAELEKFGKVRHLVKLSDSHDRDEGYYANRYKPEVWAMPNAKLGGLTATRTLGPDVPITGAVVVNYPGTGGWKECGLWIPHGGGTLVTCDALQNHCDTAQTSFMGRLMTSLMGFKGGVIVAPMWRKYQKVSGEAVRRAFNEVTTKAFANLVTGHGPAVVGGADLVSRAAVDRASA